MTHEEISTNSIVAVADAQHLLCAAGEIAQAIDALAAQLDVWEVDPAEYAAAIASGEVTYIKPWGTLTEEEEAAIGDDGDVSGLTVTPYPARTQAVALALAQWLAEVAVHTPR